MTVSTIQPMAMQASMPQVAMPQAGMVPQAMPQLGMVPQNAAGIMSPGAAAQMQQQVALAQLAAQQQAMMNPSVAVPMAAAGMVGQPVYINSLSQLPIGAVPLSQGMLSQALGQTATPPPSMMSTVVKSALKFAAIGGGAGAIVGLLPGPPGLIMGGVLGALGGAVLGAVLGVKKAKQDQAAFQQFLQGQQDQAAAVANAAGSTDGTAAGAATGAATATAALAAPKAVKAGKKRAAASRSATAAAPKQRSHGANVHVGTPAVAHAAHGRKRVTKATHS